MFFDDPLTKIFSFRAFLEQRMRTKRFSQKIMQKIYKNILTNSKSSNLNRNNSKVKPLSLLILVLIVTKITASAKSTTVAAFSFRNYRNNKSVMTPKNTIPQSEEPNRTTRAPSNRSTSRADRYDQFKNIIKYGTLAPSSHNTQCWKFKISLGNNENIEDYGSITVLPDFSRRCPVVDPDDHHLYVSLGCAVENMAIAANAYYGLDAKVDASNLSGEDGGIHVSFSPCSPGRTTKTDNDKTQSLFEAIPKRQSTRCEYNGKPLKQDELELLQLAGNSNSGDEDSDKNGNVRVILLTEPSSINTIREFVTKANTAQVENENFVGELASWIRFNRRHASECGDGLSGASAGSPLSVPAWMGRRVFPLMFRANPENQKITKQINTSAGIAIFVSSKDDPKHWVEAGRCYERFALQATALNIRNSMLNQPVEETDIRTKFMKALDLSHHGMERADLVVRFGKGPTMPSSLRRLVEDVLVETS